MPGRIRNLWRTISSFLTTGLIVLLLGYIALQMLSIDVAMKYLGFKQLLIATNSMTEVLDEGDIIFIRRANIDSLEVGNIITFYVDLTNDQVPEIVTHFLAEKTIEDGKWVLRTKPNTTTRWDSWTIGEEDVIGQYWFRIPKVGVIFMHNGDPVIIGIVVTAVSLSLAVWVLLSDDKEKEEKEAG